MKFNKVFIISTGRSGSQSIATSLNKSSEVEAYHEPVPILIRENILHYLDLLRGEEYYLPSPKDIVKNSRDDIISRTLKKGKIYVESSHFLSTFIPELYELYPDALFVHLVRDGRICAQSGINWGWYKGHSKNDITCTTQANRWGVSGWYCPVYCNTRLIKCCHYWALQNKIIEEGMKIIPKNKKMFIKLEDGTLEPLCKKLNIPTLKWYTTNKSKRGYTKFSNWGKKEQEIGIKIMGDLLKKYGYT